MRLKSIAILGSLLLVKAPLFGAAFEGKISYQITTAAGKSQMLSMSISGQKARTDMENQGHKVVAIIDMGQRTTTMLMPERKAYLIQKMRDPKELEQEAPNGKFSKTGATASIAGCSAQEWVYETDKGKTSIWLTDKFGKGFFSQGMLGKSLEIPEELKNKGGMALRITNAEGFKMEAVKIKPGAIDASLFEIPDGYSEMKVPASTGVVPQNPAGQPGAGTGGLSPEQAAHLRQAMENMSPEQKAAMEKVLQGQGTGQ